MGNTWFRFKQFTIHQDRCAMKVTTDACLFGAWTAHAISSEFSPATSPHMLDIGAGTGLLSLMCLQQHPQLVATAVELDEAAAEQAKENLLASSWRQRGSVLRHDIKTFLPAGPFDIIVSNPPFHENQLTGSAEGKNRAHHHHDLRLEELSPITHQLSHQASQLFLLYPYYREQEVLDNFGKAGWYVKALMRVRQTASHDYFRTMFHFVREAAGAPEPAGALIIMQEGHYSEAFSALLRPYYLRFQ